MSASARRVQGRPELTDRVRQTSPLAERFDRQTLALAPPEDIGVVELVSRYPKPPMLSFETDQTVFYTDNA